MNVNIVISEPKGQRDSLRETCSITICHNSHSTVSFHKDLSRDIKTQLNNEAVCFSEKYLIKKNSSGLRVRLSETMNIKIFQYESWELWRHGYTISPTQQHSDRPVSHCFCVWISTEKPQNVPINKVLIKGGKYIFFYLRWTPKPRCFPEHSRQIQIPYVTLTHWGLCAPHSKQVWGTKIRNNLR